MTLTNQAGYQTFHSRDRIWRVVAQLLCRRVIYIYVWYIVVFIVFYSNLTDHSSTDVFQCLETTQSCQKPQHFSSIRVYLASFTYLTENRNSVNVIFPWVVPFQDTMLNCNSEGSPMNVAKTLSKITGISFFVGNHESSSLLTE